MSASARISIDLIILISQSYPYRKLGSGAWNAKCQRGVVTASALTLTDMLIGFPSRQTRDCWSRKREQIYCYIDADVLEYSIIWYLSMYQSMYILLLLYCIHMYVQYSTYILEKRLDVRTRGPADPFGHLCGTISCWNNNFTQLFSNKNKAVESYHRSLL